MNRKPDPSEDAIARRAARKRQAREHPGASPLKGLSTFGMVGWSVAVPTVGGALLGLWLDRVAPQGFSWPIALILGGVVLGASIAWAWVSREGHDNGGKK